MSNKELAAHDAVARIKNGSLKQCEAATLLGVDVRTIRRWQKKVATAGVVGLAHGSRGRHSPQRLDQRERSKIVALLRAQYSDFGPTLATEKLAERHRLVRDAKTIWSIMVAEGLWQPRRPGKTSGAVHRAWRERRAHPGELVQFDGSYHHWFEDRNGSGECCLLAAIDDATGTIKDAQFAAHEGVLPVMGFWHGYAGLYGLPQSIYLDRFSTYKMTQKVAQENHDLKTQFERALKTLGVTPIFALSPQAKGRVERLFRTLQDRLVKELRLRNISNTQMANRFLRHTFIQNFNERFGVAPREPSNLHRRLSATELHQLPETFCRLEQRSVQGDFTVSFEGQWHQILPTPGLAIRPKDTVIIRQYVDAGLSFSIRGKKVQTKPIAKKRQVKLFSTKHHWVLTPNLPNRTFSFPGKPDIFTSR